MHTCAVLITLRTAVALLHHGIMIRQFSRALACVAVLCTASSAHASQVAVGDLIRFKGSLGTLGGGAFTVADVSNPTVADFLTFCVQVTQYINYSNDFRVDSITDYADDAAGPDFIAPETTWIMSNYSRGLLGSFTANDVQWAIWQLEGEKGSNWGNSAALITQAQVAVGGGWSNDGVKVLNLFWGNGTKAQDQLVYLPEVTTSAVPEPGTLALVGGGVIAAVVARRRRSRKA